MVSRNDLNYRPVFLLRCLVCDLLTSHNGYYSTWSVP